LSVQGALLCRGIQSRPAVGYLTQLEALRYLEVGGYYKSPRFPIWVCGSTSHFTVLCGHPIALHESSSEVMLERVRRAFKRQPGAEENGFIQVSQLGDLLKSLKLPDTVVSTDAQTQTLAASMEVHGAGIILWEDLWKRTSRLLSGASLESVLVQPSDVAGPATVAAAAAATSSNEMMTDEELARKLQDEWNDNDTRNNNDDVIEETTQATTTTTTTTATDTRTVIQMYHFNGLRGGRFTKFTIKKDVSDDEAVGASVALQTHQHHGAFGGGSGSLTEVLRTKWPTATVTYDNSNSNSPPSID
jgi:Domain of unknown function (DUF4205)